MITTDCRIVYFNNKKSIKSKFFEQQYEFECADYNSSLITPLKKSAIGLMVSLTAALTIRLYNQKLLCTFSCINCDVTSVLQRPVAAIHQYRGREMSRKQRHSHTVRRYRNSLPFQSKQGDREDARLVSVFFMLFVWSQLRNVK